MTKAGPMVVKRDGEGHINWCADANGGTIAFVAFSGCFEIQGLGFTRAEAQYLSAALQVLLQEDVK